MTYPSLFARIFPPRASFGLIAAFVLLFLAGCNSDTCFVGVINPPNNSFHVTTGNLPSVCSGLQTQAAISLNVQLAPLCTGCSATRQVSRVQLSLSGVELHPGAVTDENSPDWLEIAPNLAREPLQLKLEQQFDRSSVALPDVLVGRVPAGRYYQIRLRLAEATSMQPMQLPVKNSCDTGGSNCIFTESGEFHALQSLDGSLYVRVVVSSPIEVRAGQPNLLRLELSPEWLLQSTSTGASEVAPLLRGRILQEAVPSIRSF